jgi:N-acetylmuramoyl-L-alanine amidase
LESGNQPIEGQRAVMEVILNRLRLEIWPDTIYEVLSKPGQFSTWRSRNKVTKEQIEKMMEVLEIVYKEKNILTDTEYVYFKNSPHKSEDTINIEGHWFWK